MLHAAVSNQAKCSAKARGTPSLVAHSLLVNSFADSFWICQLALYLCLLLTPQARHHRYLWKTTSRHATSCTISMHHVFNQFIGACTGYGEFPADDCIPDIVDGAKFVRDLYDVACNSLIHHQIHQTIGACTGYGEFPADDCIPDIVDGAKFVRDLYEKVGDTAGQLSVTPCMYSEITVNCCTRVQVSCDPLEKLSIMPCKFTPVSMA